MPVAAASQLEVAARAARAPEAETDHGENEPPPEPASRRFQPGLEVGHRIVGNDRCGAAVVGGDEQTENATLRESKKPDTPGIHIGMGPHPFNDPQRITRIPPRKETLHASARARGVGNPQQQPNSLP